MGNYGQTSKTSYLLKSDGMNKPQIVAELQAKIDSHSARAKVSCLKPGDVLAIVDSREQTPLDLAPLRTTPGTLDTGDYSISGLEHVVRIERKSLGDLVACVGRERERFEREVMRLIAYPVRVLLIESTWQEIELGGWRGDVTTNQVIGSLLGWIASGLQVDLCGDHRRAGQHAARILFTVARRRHREWVAFSQAQTELECVA